MSRPVLIAGLIAGCVAAAGVGSYVATRHMARSAPLAAAQAPLSPGAQAAPDAAATDGTLIDLQKEVSPATGSDSPAAPETSRIEPSKPAVEEEAPRSGRAERDEEAARSTRADSERPTRAAREPEPTARPSVDRPPEPAASAEEPAVRAATLPVESPSAEPVEPSPEAVAVLEQPEGLINPRVPQRENVTVEPDAVVGLRIENTVSSATAEVEDSVEARATRDVLVGNLVALPAGTELRGSVVEVDRGSRLKGGARLGVRFHTVVLDDGTELPLRTETIYREGASQSDRSTAKIGGAAVGGAILGAILGGGKGAAIGAAAGAGGGTAAAMAQRVEPAVLRAGSNVTVRLTEPFTIEIEH